MTTRCLRIGQPIFNFIRYSSSNAKPLKPKPSGSQIPEKVDLSPVSATIEPSSIFGGVKQVGEDASKQRSDQVETKSELKAPVKPGPKIPEPRIYDPNTKVIHPLFQ